MPTEWVKNTMDIIETFLSLPDLPLEIQDN